ncbi:hypothetical protein SAMN05421878_102127 [Actinobaculum suis]|uniref:DUF5926 family protein n=1 Tax=Actinobaculum suis TaxID=1657 RepID=A0A1G7A8Y3_9ACTO|nr:DUF5926 family protein [Actinobaculum suis]MDY5152645.1 DUF5926 family protein [Actinobaculum suis]SDE11230.1 hypothetical protein SAMN05421878_102127 [Actinobaculum suis]
MAKKSRRRNRADRPKQKRVQIPFVERAFADLDAELDLVAMREVLPLATLPATTTAEYGEQEVLISTLLPGMAAAYRRQDGKLLVAVQTLTASGDASLDIAHRIIAGADLAAGESFNDSELPEPDSPRLQDMIASFGTLELHNEVDFWFTAEEAKRPEIAEAMHNIEANMIPSARVEGIENAYWCRMNNEFLRWIRPEPRAQVLDGLARLRGRGEEKWEEGVRLAGTFRAQGLCVPVWQLVRGTEADELAGPLAEFAPKLGAAIASTEPLTAEEKRARAGITSRQVTLR